MTSRKLLLPIALGLVMLISCGTGLAQTGSAWEPWGPRADEIIMTIIGERQIALERGLVDVAPEIGGGSIAKLKSNRNIDLVMTPRFSASYLWFNMRRAPLDADPVRQAMACIVDRDAITSKILKSEAIPLATIVPPWNPYFNSNTAAFPYDLTKAGEILDRAGYTVDRKTKMRIDPNTGKTMREMKILTPKAESSPTMAQIGKMIADAARKVGLPVKHEPVDFLDMLGMVDDRNFDMYILAWSLDRNPDYLESLFHSRNAGEGGYNTSGIALPELDQALEDLERAPDLDAARQAAMEAQAIIARKQPMAILYSEVNYAGFRKDKVTGYVSMPGYGAAGYNNKWTQLNIRNIKDKANTVRWLLANDPRTLNPCTASSQYDMEPLMWITDKLIEVHPETLEDVPWLAKEWEVDTWEAEPGRTATVVTLHLQEGVKWHDGMPFTAEDIKFTIDYLRDNVVFRYFNLTRNVARVQLTSRYTVKVYFDSVSCWNLYCLGELPILPKHIWKDVKDWKAFEPWNEPHPTVKGLTKLIGTGPFIFKEYKPGKHVRLVKNPNYWRLPAAE
jgi:peptide/nickel transport system substrate-binding protein